jgi:hypothetical protein
VPSFGLGNNEFVRNSCPAIKAKGYLTPGDLVYLVTECGRLMVDGLAVKQRWDNIPLVSSIHCSMYHAGLKEAMPHAAFSLG